MPRFVPPQLALLVEAAPEGDEWLHEVKLDGYRLQCLVHGSRVALLTRRGHDWTHRFPALARWLAGRRWSGAALDGELVVLGPDGKSSFRELQARLADGNPEDVTFYAFDLLQHRGASLVDLPLLSRKVKLRRLLGKGRPGALVRYSDHTIGRGPHTLAAACRQGLEGIICKRSDAPYRSGRGRDWLKVKCIQQQELVVIGFTAPKGSRTGLGSLLVAVRDDDGALRYAGRVGSGFSGSLLTQLRARLERSVRATAPIAPAPPAPAGTVWVSPKVVIEARFTEWTADGLLRHPTFLGVREDKMATQVKREVAAAGDQALTHPDKVLYPEQGLTKRDLASYYERVAPLMLPHVAGRPLSLVRCPDGRKGSCFYQKHLTGRYPEALGTVPIRQSDGIKPHAVIEDVDGLIGLVQMGVLELHLWGARADRVEAPDRIVFDLDPGSGVDWAAVCDGAEEIRHLLQGVGLESWVKTTGGKGVHIVAPIERRNSWEEVAAFARTIAVALEQHAPKRYLSRAAKADRPGRIFVDWLRNTRGATTVAVWSTRARAGAAISFPCDWSELRAHGGADTVSVRSVLDQRSASRRDPWKALLSTRQRLPRGAK